MPAGPTFSTAQVRAFRLARQQVDGASRELLDVDVLDLGVQDTGGDGGRWALACRGVDLDAASDVSGELVLAWALRGAPAFYRRRQAAAVAAATAPWSEADAAARLFDGVRPLRAAGIDALAALDHVADVMRSLAASPLAKGELSAGLTERLDPPYLRRCRPCDATHVYEQTFRLCALRAGLELEPGTSPPVVRRIPGWRGPAKRVPPQLDVVRSVLRFLGPASAKDIAGFVGTTAREVEPRLPPDAVEVVVEGTGRGRRWALEGDLDDLAHPPDLGRQVRLLAPFDLFLQARDREVLVDDDARRKQLWVVLGRPGAVLVGPDVVGSWRPRATAKALAVEVDLWGQVPEGALEQEAQRLAAFRGLALRAVTAAAG